MFWLADADAIKAVTSDRSTFRKEVEVVRIHLIYIRIISIKYYFYSMMSSRYMVEIWLLLKEINGGAIWRLQAQHSMRRTMHLRGMKHGGLFTSGSMSSIQTRL